MLASQNPRTSFVSLLLSDLARFEALMECNASPLRLLARRSAREAGQNAEVDDWSREVEAAKPVHACFDQLIVALDTAVWAEERANIALKSRSLMRALTVVIALQMSVRPRHKLAGDLTDFYETARKCIADSSTAFDAEGLGAIRSDFAGIRDALMMRSDRLRPDSRSD